MCRTATTTMGQHPNTTKPLRQRVAKASSSRAVMKKRRGVQFAAKVKVALKSVSQQELADTWYNPLEYRNFQRESKVSLKAVTRNICGDSNAYDATQHCLRGLEACLSPEVYLSRKGEKAAIVAEVLKQQLFNRLVGVNDPETLAFISKGISQKAQERALLLAAFDCKEHLRHQEACIISSSSFC